MSVKLFRDIDVVSIGPPECGLVEGAKKSAEMFNLPYTLYDRKSFLAKYPQFRVRKHEVAIVDHAAGLVYPELCIKTFLEHAEKNGAKILENARVKSWSENAKGIKIVLEDGSVIEAEQLVITAGAYTTQLVKDLGVNLRVTR